MLFYRVDVVLRYSVISMQSSAVIHFSELKLHSLASFGLVPTPRIRTYVTVSQEYSGKVRAVVLFQQVVEQVQLLTFLIRDLQIMLQ